MKAKHIIKVPRSGKTNEILERADESSMVVLHRPELKNQYRDLNQKAIILVAGEALTGNNFPSVKKVFIDELLAFRSEDLKWLNNLLYNRIALANQADLQVFAYSTPTKFFSKELYTLARVYKFMDWNKVMKMPNTNAIPEKQQDLMEAAIEEMDAFLLLDELIVDRDSINRLDDTGIRQIESSLTANQFDMMYNLNFIQ